MNNNPTLLIIITYLAIFTLDLKLDSFVYKSIGIVDLIEIFFIIIAFIIGLTGFDELERFHYLKFKEKLNKK